MAPLPRWRSFRFFIHRALRHLHADLVNELRAIYQEHSKKLGLIGQDLGARLSELGRIIGLGATLNSKRGIPRIPCWYEEHTSDLEDNRILLWTLHCVRRQALRQEKIRNELDRARRALEGTITLEQCSPTDCVKNRLNDDYAPMHGLCRFILEQTGPGLRPSDHVFIPFELNMPQLFELFVAEWLRANAPPGTIVRRKYQAQLDANFEMKIEIDILLYEERSQRPVAVLDTKYKTDEQPSEEDIYQIAFHARELQVRRVAKKVPTTLAGIQKRRVIR